MPDSPTDRKQPRFSRGDVIAKRFEIESELGSGLLGASYLARRIDTGKHLVLKVVRPSIVANPRDRQRFTEVFNEARKVDDEGVVKLGELVDEGGIFAFTQMYFKSQSLRALIDEYQAAQRSFTLQEACQIIAKVLGAVAALHDRGIVHRNLKPENVLVESRSTGPGGKNVVRTIKITDAGLSEVINPTIFAESFISRSDAKYLAPELEGFEDAAAPQADVYSCGLMLYELLVGQPPRGTYLSPTQLRGDLPDHIDDVVENALQQIVADRYPSARDMIADLQRSFEPDADDKPARSSTRTILIAAVAAISVVVGIGAYVTSREPEDKVAALKLQDDKLRAEVQGKSRVPTEDELRAMVQQHQEMLYIPPGPFLMGRLHQEDLAVSASQAEPLAKEVEVAGFFIDRYEFPNQLSKDAKVAPTTKVTYEEANNACAELGKRLCTEAEWEKACKGPGNWIYAYSDTFDEARCGGGLDAPYQIGDHEDCVSGYGVQGMSVGPREWTGSQPSSNTARRIVKGGMKGKAQRGSRCAFAVDESANFAGNNLSFRCCLDVGGATVPAPAPAGG
ncbi:MAG: protein kinase [Deltaproteobacteria bacterium]|nr:protein kinase [Deltaproteobacteria bacterium]